MCYKEETRECYERYTAAFAVKFERQLARYISNELDLFMNALGDADGRRILDLGLDNILFIFVLVALIHFV